MIRVTMKRAALALVMPLAMLGLASPALAVEHHPTGDFAPFADCPLSNPSVTSCIVANTTSGEFTVGKKTVPINKTITLQGGTITNPETGELTFVGAENGETLSKTALYVPGGLFGIKAPEYLNKEQKERFEEMINKGLTGVTETTELAKPASEIGISTNNLIDRRRRCAVAAGEGQAEQRVPWQQLLRRLGIEPGDPQPHDWDDKPAEPNEPIKGNVGTLNSRKNSTSSSSAAARSWTTRSRRPKRPVAARRSHRSSINWSIRSSVCRPRRDITPRFSPASSKKRALPAVKASE